MGEMTARNKGQCNFTNRRIGPKVADCFPAIGICEFDLSQANV